MKYIVVLLIGIVFLAGCTQTQEPQRDFIQENTDIYNVLLQDGFDALVDTTEDRVLVRFDLPQNYTSEASVYIVLASVSAITKSDLIIVQIYRNEKKIEEVRAKNQDVLDIVNDKISVEELIRNLEWKKF